MTGPQDQVRDLYASFWGLIESIQSGPILNQFLSNVDLDAGWFKDKQCADIGSGSGFATWAMDYLGATCSACDISVPALQHIQSELSGRASAEREVAASALNLPYADESFDFVHCNGVLHHTLDPRRGFSEVVRVARPGATVFVSVYGRGGLYNAAVDIVRKAARVVPYRVARRFAEAFFADRTLPNSFMPAKISFLDNAYVAIRNKYTEAEVRRWFAEEGFQPDQVIRTKSTIYDHETARNRLIHGEGYLQFRAVKP